MTAASVPEDDPLAGLPPDLARVLRDPSIIVPQDQAVFELIAEWQAARSDTPSADLSKWDHALWLQTRLGEARQRIADLEDVLGKLDGKVFHVRSGRWLIVDAEEGSVRRV